MNEDLITQVEELGLSEKEARVYLANLSLGPSTVQKISEHSGIKRVTTYVILESLVNLGLVSQAIKGKKTLFIAEEPLSLKRLIEKKERELSQQKANFETLLPELLGVKNIPKDSPRVKFYDSTEGIKSIMTTFLSSHKNEKLQFIFGISNLDQLYTFFPEFKEHAANPTRVREGVPSKIIYTYKGGPVFKETDHLRNRESRWVPLEKYPLNGDISIVGDHIIMLSLTGNKPIGITIDSHELAVGLTGIFNLAWTTAEQYN